ncbi:unnamed protein product [Chrysoparadoxa australica]
MSIELLAEELAGLEREGLAFMRSHQLSQAEEVFTRAAKRIPDFEDEDGDCSAALAPLASSILCYRSEVYLALRKFVAALAAAQSAESIDQTCWKAPWQQGLALMGLEPRIERSQMAVQAFERCLASSTLPKEHIEQVKQAISCAKQRLEHGRDAVDLPDNCVIS